MKNVILIFLILFSIHFWGFIYIQPVFHNITNTLSLLIMGFSFLRTLQKDGLQFRKAIILFFIGIIINIISVYINQGQDPLETFIMFGRTYFFILFYFFLHDLQVSQKQIEKIIIVFAILYSLFYILQMLAYPTLIFDNDMYEDRGTIRLRIEGNGFLMLGYFLLLNRYFSNHRLMDLLLASGFFIILLIAGFRTLTFAAFLLSGFMFLKLVKYSIWNYAVLIFLFFLIVGLFQFQVTSRVINEMIFATIEQKEEGLDYIRLRELYYYFYTYPQNISYFLMGGGLPGYRGFYALIMETVKLDYGYYWTDLGLIGFYIVIGPLTLLGLLWYTIKAITRKVPPEILYTSIYFIFLLIVSFTTQEIYRQGIFAVQAIGLYLIDISLVKKNSLLQIQ